MAASGSTTKKGLPVFQNDQILVPYLVILVEEVCRVYYILHLMNGANATVCNCPGDFILHDNCIES